MEFKKGMKKALSVLLSLSMVVTGVTVSGKEAKAEGEPEYYIEITPAYQTTNWDNSIVDHYDYTGTVQEGKVTIEGKVTDGEGETSSVYGKIRLTSSDRNFVGTTDYVRAGQFSATVDISQCDVLSNVPVKVEFLVGNVSKAAVEENDEEQATSINVNSTSGVKVWADGYDDWKPLSSDFDPVLVEFTEGREDIEVSFDVCQKWEDSESGESGNSPINYAKVKIHDFSDENKGADLKNFVTVSSVKFDDTEILTKDDSDLITGKDTFITTEGDDATVEIINSWNGSALVTDGSKRADGTLYQYTELKELFDDSLDKHTITVTLTVNENAAATPIADPAAPATDIVDVSTAEDPTPEPAPSTDTEGGNGDTTTTTGSAVTATVTAVAMAPQAMTATAGSVTTMAAVLTVTGSSLDLLKVNNTVAANNATVSAVSTSGITVALTAPANVTSESAAATFAAVVTVPASVATGEYALTASVGAVKANVATVSVIAAGTGETPVEDVHTTKLKIKTANGTNKSAVMGVGETAKLKVVKTPADSVDAVTAVSAKAKVVKASVNKAGKLVLKAKKAGTAKVTVTSGEVSKKITVTVKKAPKKLTLKDGKKAAKKTVKLAANTKKKAVKKTYKITLPKNTASYDYTVKKTGKVVKSAVVKTNKKNVQTLVVTVKKKAKGSGKIVITSNANKKAKATVKVKAK